MNENITKTKLYTIAEVKELIVKVITEVTYETICDEDCEDSSKVAFIETLVGAKILTKIDEMREKGEA